MNVKKKLLFVVPNLKVGGVTSAFVNLINALKNSDMEIDVLSFDDSETYILPEFVKVLPTNKFLKMLTVSQQTVNKESRLLGLFRLICGALVKFLGQGFVYKFLLLSYKKLRGYDAAISYTQTANSSLFGGCNEFVLQRCISPNKITFLHCDYKECGIDTKYSKKIYNKFDKIAVVSEGVKKRFLQCRPELSNKVFTVYNCHLFERIQDLAKENPVEYSKNKVNFVTVARLSKEKGHERMLNIFAMLKNEGYDFCWHIVGGGSRDFENKFNGIISENNLNDNVKLYGEQANPYRFMVNADMLLVPSFHEAAPMVFTEALSLNLPIISTNTLSAYEFITKNNFGLVCENNEFSVYDNIKSILDDIRYIECFRENIKNSFVRTNNIAIQHFYKVLGCEFYG